MNTDRLTTIFGALAAFGQVLHSAGINLGHFGTVDGSSFITCTGLFLLGLFTNKKNGATTAPQEKPR